MSERPPLIVERVRRIGKSSFAFIPHRFLRDGFLASLTANERSLYLFLVLAADRQGISFWSYERICSVLGLYLEQYLQARKALIEKDLLAFDGTRFQVLDLPEKPKHLYIQSLRDTEELEEHDPATIRALILDGRSDPPFKR